jgi:hypothetical protein
MDWQFLISIIPVAAGVLLGAFAKEIGVFMQVGREDKRLLKRVLFHQLNLWWELWRSDYGYTLSLVDEEFSAALRRLGASPEQTTGLFHSAKPQIITLFTEAKMTSPQEIFEQYQEAVKELAEVDPVTAYQINFRFSGGLREKLDELVERAREMEDAADKPPTDKIIIDRLFTRLHEASNRELIARLEDDMLHVARRVGWRTRRDIRRTIKEMPGRVRKDVQELVEQMLAQIASLMAEVRSPSEQSQPPSENTHGLSRE